MSGSVSAHDTKMAPPGWSERRRPALWGTLEPSPPGWSPVTFFRAGGDLASQNFAGPNATLVIFLCKFNDKLTPNANLAINW